MLRSDPNATTPKGHLQPSVVQRLWLKRSRDQGRNIHPTWGWRLGFGLGLGLGIGRGSKLESYSGRHLVPSVIVTTTCGSMEMSIELPPRQRELTGLTRSPQRTTRGHTQGHLAAPVAEEPNQNRQRAAVESLCSRKRTCQTCSQSSSMI